MAEQAAQAAQRHDQHRLFHITKTLGRSAANPPKMIKAEDGTTVATTLEASARWLRHFAGLH
eukprot:4260482-Alexandrium_andersonii.AAC.1